MLIINKFIYIILISMAFTSQDSIGLFTISRIHYGGGGDWYSDKSSIPNLLNFVKENTNVAAAAKEITVKIGDDSFYANSYFYMTGHGNIKLTSEEIVILRDHLINGAFLHADDNYGMDASFRNLVADLFPDKKLIEIPPSHDLFNVFFKLPNGLPKIHEHNNKRPQALGIFHENRLILLYTYECDLGDGWENSRVHNIDSNLREQALQMGSNIIIHSLIQ